MARTILIEAVPWDSAGTATNIYLAGGGSRGYTHRGRSSWKAGIADDPKFTGSIGFDESGWTGGSTAQTTKVRWFPSGKAGLSSVAAYQWIKAPITVLAGDDAVAAPTWTAIVTGTVASIKITGGAIEFTIADLSVKLLDPFLTARFAGTGGIEGPAEAEGRIKRRAFGKVFNVEGLILDKANNIWEFGNPAFPINAFTAVRDKGRVAAPAPATVAWQGSAAATFAALQASAPASGSCVVAPSIACVKWWTQPAGPLTADIQGDVGAGYVNTVVTIAQRIVTGLGLGWMAPTAAVLAAPAGTAEAGIYVGDDGDTGASILDRLLLGAGLVWVFDPAGSVQAREFTLANPVETLAIVDDVERVEAYRPNLSRKIAYQRSYRVHTDAEISAAVKTADIEGLGGLATASSVAFNDGTVKSSTGATATDSAYQTGLGTALAIANQAPAATDPTIQTGATKGADLNANIVDSGSAAPTTPVPRTEIRTPLGTALAFANQGPLATRVKATISYADSDVTGFGALAPRSFAYFGSSFLTEDSGGSTPAALAAFKTSSGTALGIANQAPAATDPTIETGSTRNVSERAINRNSAFQDGTTGWTISPYGGPNTTVGASANSIRGGQVAFLSPNGGIKSEHIACTPGETLYFAYRFATTANRTGGASPTWYVGITFATAVGVADVTSVDVPGFSGGTVSLAAGPQVGVYAVTVPAGYYAMRSRIALDFGSAGTGATGYCDYIEIHRDEPGSDVTANKQISTDYSAPTVTINLDATGGIAGGQLPLTLPRPTVLRGGVSVAGDNLTTYTVSGVSSSLGAVTPDNTNGSSTKGAPTIPNTMTGAGSFTLNVFYNGVAAAAILIKVVTKPAVAGSSGGGSSTVGTISVSDVVSSTTDVQLGSNIVTVVVASGKAIGVGFGATFNVTGVSKSGTATVTAQYSPTGASTWSAIGSSASGTATVDADGNQSPGSVSLTRTVSPAAGTYDVRLVCRRSGTAGSVTLDPTSATVSVS